MTETSQSDKENVVDDLDAFYKDAKTYWTGVPPTVDGMLGGFEKISPTDINGSKAFLRPFLKVGGGNTETKKALDCGSGIGRITKRLLLPVFESVDMVELNQKFLDAAPRFVGEDASRIGNFFCSGLQDFTPEEGKYDIIWSQWVLGHLTDDDLVDFFKRCQKGLTEGGIMIVKENVTCSKQREFDELDSSFTRSKDVLVELMRKSGMTILKEQKQRGFPKGLYSVYMYALK